MEDDPNLAISIHQSDFTAALTYAAQEAFTQGLTSLKAEDTMELFKSLTQDLPGDFTVGDLAATFKAIASGDLENVNEEKLHAVLRQPSLTRQSLIPSMTEQDEQNNQAKHIPLAPVLSLDPQVARMACSKVMQLFPEQEAPSVPDLNSVIAREGLAAVDKILKEMGGDINTQLDRLEQELLVLSEFPTKKASTAKEQPAIKQVKDKALVEGPSSEKIRSKKEQPVIKQVKAKTLTKKQQKAEARRKEMEMAAIAEALKAKAAKAEDKAARKAKREAKERDKIEAEKAEREKVDAAERAARAAEIAKEKEAQRKKLNEERERRRIEAGKEKKKKAQENRQRQQRIKEAEKQKLKDEAETQKVEKRTNSEYRREKKELKPRKTSKEQVQDIVFSEQPSSRISEKDKQELSQRQTGHQDDGKQRRGKGKGVVTKSLAVVEKSTADSKKSTKKAIAKAEIACNKKLSQDFHATTEEFPDLISSSNDQGSVEHRSTPSQNLASTRPDYAVSKTNDTNDDEALSPWVNKPIGHTNDDVTLPDFGKLHTLEESNTVDALTEMGHFLSSWKSPALISDGGHSALLSDNINDNFHDVPWGISTLDSRHQEFSLSHLERGDSWETQEEPSVCTEGNISESNAARLGIADFLDNNSSDKVDKKIQKSSNDSYEGLASDHNPFDNQNFIWKRTPHESKHEVPAPWEATLNVSQPSHDSSSHGLSHHSPPVNTNQGNVGSSWRIENPLEHPWNLETGRGRAPMWTQSPRHVQSANDPWKNGNTMPWGIGSPQSLPSSRNIPASNNINSPVAPAGDTTWNSDDRDRTVDSTGATTSTWQSQSQIRPNQARFSQNSVRDSTSNFSSWIDQNERQSGWHHQGTMHDSSWHQPTQAVNHLPFQGGTAAPIYGSNRTPHWEVPVTGHSARTKQSSAPTTGNVSEENQKKTPNPTVLSIRGFPQMESARNLKTFVATRFPIRMYNEFPDAGCVLLELTSPVDAQAVKDLLLSVNVTGEQLQVTFAPSGIVESLRTLILSE